MVTTPSELIYTVTGSPQTQFAVPPTDVTPEYFTTSDTTLYVELNGSTQTINVNYTETPVGYVTFTVAVPVGSTVRIYRVTKYDAPLVTASSASMFSVTMFNKGFWQMIFLIQELWVAVAKCISYIIISSGEIVWDFENKRAVSCLDPTGDQDVSTKHYVDQEVAEEAAARIAGDAATLAAANSYTDLLRAYLMLQITTIYNYINAQDMAIYAYIRKYIQSITVVSGGVAMITPVEQTVTAGTTRIFFPIKVYDLVLTIDGVLQIPMVDYTPAPGYNYVDLVAALSTDVSVNAYIVSTPAGANTFDPTVVSISAGDTVITTFTTFDNAIVTMDGVTLLPTTDYTHTLGTNVFTLTTPAIKDCTIQVIGVDNGVFTFVTETISAAAGDTVITASSSFDVALVFIDGFLQTIGTDYGHVFNTNTITLTTPLVTDSSIQIIKVG